MAVRSKQEIFAELENLRKELESIENSEKIEIPKNEIPEIIITEEYIFHLFSMAQLHDEDYDSYLLVENYINCCLRNKCIELQKQIEHKQLLIDEYKKELNSLNQLEKTQNTKKKKIENNIKDYEYLKKCDNEELLKTKRAIKEYKIFKKDEPIITGKLKPIYKKWLKMQYAELDYMYSIRKPDFKLLQKQIELDEIKMKEIIKETNNKFILEINFERF